MIIASHHKSLCKNNKIITNLKSYAKSTAKERLTEVANKNMQIKQAVQAAREEERKHYAALLADKTKIISAKELIISLLIDRAIGAERLYKKTRLEAN